MRLRHKKWAASTIEKHPDTALNLDDLDRLPSFNYLEIGSGKGRFLLTMAKRHPDRSYLGVEINYNAFSLAIKLSESDEFKEMERINYAFLNAPFQKVFEKILPSSLDCIYLNFSDPWPRNREHKRRLTYPTLLHSYRTVLKVGGEVRFKSDNELLYANSLKYFSSVDGFKVVLEGVYEKEDEEDVMTEFEEKFRQQGKKIYRIIARKDH